MGRIAVTIAAAGLALFSGIRAAHTLHIGAPPLPYHCPAGQQVRRWWVPDSSPEGRGAPGTLEYHGYREIAACTSGLDISAG